MLKEESIVVRFYASSTDSLKNGKILKLMIQLVSIMI